MYSLKFHAEEFTEYGIVPSVRFRIDLISDYSGGRTAVWRSEFDVDSKKMIPEYWSGFGP